MHCLTFIFVTLDYVENLPCLKKIKNETVSLCVNEACRENKDATKKLLEAAATIRYTQDFNNLKTLIGDNCKYANFFIHKLQYAV